MRVGILETGILEERLAMTHGGFPEMFENWLSPHLQDAEFESFCLLDDVWPESPSACDAWLITGSRFGVYDPTPWMEPLKQLVRDIAEAERPLIGICFGHQIVAEALGGKAEKSHRGWGTGLQAYEIEIDGTRQQVPLLVSHQDQVTTLAPGARVIGGSDHCPMGVIAYQQKVLTAQFHPEFHPALSAAIIRLRAGTSFPEELAARALDSLATPPDNHRIGAWMGAWLHQNL